MFYPKEDLLETSTKSCKPDKEEARNKPYSFPKYLNEKIDIPKFKESILSLIDYVPLSQNSLDFDYEYNRCDCYHLENEYSYHLYDTNENINNYNNYIKENAFKDIKNDAYLYLSYHDYNFDYERKEEDFNIKYDNIIEDGRTTCMIKNIPNKFTADMLIEFMNHTHFGKYDFLYLRMDFKNKCNVGYAFVNFVDTLSVKDFFLRINGKRWSSLGSSKIAELTYASIQGQDKLIRKFKRSSVMNENISFRPKIFYVEGENKGKEKPFV